MSTAATATVVFFGSLVCILSIWGTFFTEALWQLVRGVADRPWGVGFAAFVRIILGAALLLAADTARFPLVFEVLGWITLAAAVGIVLLGQRGMRRTMDWFHARGNAFLRAWFVVGLAFGLFLVYGTGVL